MQQVLELLLVLAVAAVCMPAHAVSWRVTHAIELLFENGGTTLVASEREKLAGFLSKVQERGDCIEYAIVEGAAQVTLEGDWERARRLAALRASYVSGLLKTYGMTPTLIHARASEASLPHTRTITIEIGGIGRGAPGCT